MAQETGHVAITVQQLERRQQGRHAAPQGPPEEADDDGLRDLHGEGHTPSPPDPGVACGIP